MGARSVLAPAVRCRFCCLRLLIELLRGVVWCSRRCMLLLEISHTRVTASAACAVRLLLSRMPAMPRRSRAGVTLKPAGKKGSAAESKDKAEFDAFMDKIKKQQAEVRVSFSRGVCCRCSLRFWV